MQNKIIQKDVTFDINLTCSILMAGKVFRRFRQNYNVEHINKSWSIKKPFTISAVVRVSIKHDVDVSKMREVQGDLLRQDKLDEYHKHKKTGDHTE